ncbi:MULTISPECIES: hypothetical protein [Myxococcus]|nr:MULTISPECIES: hypothetical protein [Myxococcus]NOJ53657.1 hypothetical protein [Myxococcus xanthus]QPM77750.1 hypothetical protein I5Q59_26035 [Myxococcus xanthus]QVW66818.1 hypothetical protein JTM82_31385 [Myxococcus xanthus DZ2]QZZ52928.1 hypothetical protein MyxoNM_27315 [Myxococcus xanthus]UEO07054.1 hypothetical protein K1515_11405 [Myxococcus xanthus DZ2]
MRGLSQLTARCAGLWVLAAAPAWAQQQEEVWLDTRSAAPVMSQMVLKQGWPHLVTMQGTFNVWGNNIVPGPQSGQPEPAPMFPSPGVTNRNVGFDPEFVFAGVKPPAVAPLRASFIQLSLDGGKTWAHPASTADFNAAEHKYGYEVTGGESALQVRIADKPVTDNSGRLKIVVVPAEELWLNTRSAAPVPSKQVLQKGKPYRVTMQGTFNVWGNNIVPGPQSGQPEPAPMFPSPGVTNRNVGFDPEFAFAGVKPPAAAPLRMSAVQVSLDGGKTWKHPASTADFNAAEHKYTYDLTGEDAPLQVRFADSPVNDNSGLVRILVLPGA